jgi:uncharacterized protein (DUF2141 family)
MLVIFSPKNEKLFLYYLYNYDKENKKMYRKLFLLLALLILGVGHLFAQVLTVRIENADVGKGSLMVGVFAGEKDFPNVHFVGERVSVSNGTMIVTFDKLPIGRYAVSVYQDSNNNSQLDTGLFGIPTEKYGFSNGARRPDFNNCVFDFNGNMTITIRIK